MIIRPGVIRLIAGAIVGIGYGLTIALAYIRGKKIIKEKPNENSKSNEE